MAIPATIVLADAEATPVNHTFTPVQDGPVAKFVNSTGATLLSGQETLAVEVHRPKTDAAQGEARVVTWDPVEGNVDGQMKVLRGLSATTTFKFPPGTTIQERKNLRKMHANALANADILSAIENMVPFI